jgi:uncharacterized protein YciI
MELRDKFNTGCLAKGEGYVPSMQGVVVYLNGGDDLSVVLARVGKVRGESIVEENVSLQGSRSHRLFRRYGGQQDWPSQHGLIVTDQSAAKCKARKMKRHFLIKLIPPRTTFALDMTDAEKRLMQEHLAYWTSLAAKGVALLFGPVLDLAGSYGIGVVRVEKEEDVHVITANDPVAKSGSQFRHEAYVMPQVIVPN